VHWSVHDARGYGVEADSFFGIFDCKTPGHRIQAPLRNHRNRAIYASDRLIGTRRGHAHNAPGFLFQHLLHSKLSDVEESQQVGREQGIKVLGGEVREGLGEVDSSVVHQNIDAAEVLDRCFDSCSSGLLLTDIAIDENQVA
jgi:hypothetical protein